MKLSVDDIVELAYQGIRLASLAKQVFSKDTESVRFEEGFFSRKIYIKKKQ